MPRFFESIPGWSEFVSFYEEVLQQTPGPAIFVEIGLYQGRSACWMAEAIKESGKPITFYGVDHFKGSEEHAEEMSRMRKHGTSLEKTFRRNMRAAGVSEFINVLAMPSLEASHVFEDESIDFAYLDASHDYDSVKADIEAWWPKIKTGGIFAGHDYSAYWPGVVKAVKEFSVAHSTQLHELGSTWKFIK